MPPDHILCEGVSHNKFTLHSDLPPVSPLHDYKYPETPDSCKDVTSHKLHFDYDPDDTFEDLDEASNCKFLIIKTSITITFLFNLCVLMVVTLVVPRCTNSVDDYWSLIPNEQ